MAAAVNAGLTYGTGSLDSTSFASDRVVVWQANGSTVAQAQALQPILETFLSGGGSLLVALDNNTGPGPFALSALLPTTAFRTNAGLSEGNGPDGAIAAAEWDLQLFPNSEPQGLNLPFHVRMRPVDAVEGGQWRYEEFAQAPTPYLNQSLPAGNTFWSRPLQNRQWTTRLRGQGVEQIPLLITGQYGAGRVAVFAASLDAAESSAPTPTWNRVLGWLNGPLCTESGTAQVKISGATADLTHHAVSLALQNTGTTSLDGLIVVR